MNGIFFNKFSKNRACLLIIFVLFYFSCKKECDVKYNFARDNNNHNCGYFYYKEDYEKNMMLVVNFNSYGFDFTLEQQSFDMSEITQNSIIISQIIKRILIIAGVTVIFATI
ncbi:MAG: hypothetical protein LBV69_06815 [Bacteroidales bacterium]|jgi:hypothetical protein|nr:hypothetical protein [Bacteroidales bacterium]